MTAPTPTVAPSDAHSRRPDALAPSDRHRTVTDGAPPFGERPDGPPSHRRTPSFGTAPPIGRIGLEGEKGAGYRLEAGNSTARWRCSPPDMERSSPQKWWWGRPPVAGFAKPRAITFFPRVADESIIIHSAKGETTRP